jgi:hypothetical protein
MKYLPLIFILLAGCSVDNPTEHLTTEVQVDESTGLTLHPSDNMWVSFPEMVAIYEATEACMGMTAPAPEVYFKSFEDYFNGGVGAVWGFHTKGTIYINTDLGTPEYEAYGFYRDKYTDTEVLKHEYIHSILYYNTGDGDASHSSEMYELCGMGVNLSN